MHTMLNPTIRILTVLALGYCCQLTSFASWLPMTDSQRINSASAIFVGEVESTQAFEEAGSIYTRSVLRVDEPFKGRLPSRLEVIHRGGQLQSRGESCCGTPQLAAGEKHLFFIGKDKQGRFILQHGERGALKLSAKQDKLLTELRAKAAKGGLGGENFTNRKVTSFSPQAAALIEGTSALASSATNLSTGFDGIPSRFLAPDSGKEIPYLIDADHLPAGITLSQAVSAVSAALGVWTNASSVRFSFAGLRSFGKAATSIPDMDGTLRIQLHDQYNEINGGSELGVGGGGWSIQNTSSGWTTGGNVAGNDFHARKRGFVVLEHTHPSMSDLSTFTEVLTHEIGHALGLGHSSQSSPEPDALLRESIMFWMAHADGRGARLNQWDTNVVRQAHPYNTPPVAFNRYLDVVTGPSPINVSGVNSATVRPFDLQGTTPTLSTAEATSYNGTFSAAGTTISFSPAGWFSDGDRHDPSSGYNYDSIYFRFSDGVNQSPWRMVAVLSLNSDTFNQGIPDWWRNTWFGSADPNAGPNRKANDDFDSDGVTNLEEWLEGSDPTSRTSSVKAFPGSQYRLRLEGRDGEVYEVRSSTNLTDWILQPVHLAFEGGVAEIGIAENQRKEFFQLRRVP